MTPERAPHEVEQWGRCEIELAGPTSGNPFLDVQLSATFRHDHRRVTVAGFYDGDGVYRVRHMPDTQGEWTWRTHSDRPELDGREGAFTCTPPREGSHGPVRVDDAHHFRYADGTPYYQVGTTCYAWTHQTQELQQQTLATLRGAPFNKLRMCVFPKRYTFNQNEPELYPFQGEPPGDWDFTRPNPAFFRHLERRVGDLMELGMEADLILFHPYDGGHWGFDRMPADADDRYLRYLVARVAAYRNVWWSFANEFDIMGAKTDADWDRFFRIVAEQDPCAHLRSIHNCVRWYDHTKPWVTHVSVQGGTDDVAKWRDHYGKPIVVDECCYEGDIEFGWGNITAQELVRRFWTALVRGGYAGHGETYLHPDDVLWWSKGGVLHGESPPRIAFMRRMMEEGPDGGFGPVRWGPSWNFEAAGKHDDDCVLVYFGFRQPRRYFLDFPADTRYRIEVVDTWGMTVEPVEGVHTGRTEVALPGRPYMALRLQRA
jgi:hypothetical protein